MHYLRSCLYSYCSPFTYVFFFFFFFNDTATTEIYTLSLHDALPISPLVVALEDVADRLAMPPDDACGIGDRPDRKSTRLNSSHLGISYAVFCLKKKKKQNRTKHKHYEYNSKCQTRNTHNIATCTYSR